MIKTNLLKSIMLCVAAGLMISQSMAQVVTSPRNPSPAAEVKQTVGLSTVTINYSRPNVILNETDRTGKIYGTGNPAPYGYSDPFPGFGSGNKWPWRAGANENTTISFSHDAKVEGKPISAGTYALFMALKEDGGATVILSNNAGSWGSFFYDEKENAMTAEIQSKDILQTNRLTYNFIDIDNSSMVVALDWEKKRFPFKVEFDATNIVLSSMRGELRGTGGFGWQGYNAAANYALNNGGDLEEALAWADKSIAGTSNFNNLNTKASILTKMEKADEAKKTMDIAMEQGNPFQIHQYGRTLIGQEKFDEALEIFKFNSEKHKDTWPVNYGMARGLSAKGDYKGALKYLTKALENAPGKPQKDAVQANIDKLEKGEDIN